MIRFNNSYIGYIGSRISPFILEIVIDTSYFSIIWCEIAKNLDFDGNLLVDLKIKINKFIHHAFINK